MHREWKLWIGRLIALLILGLGSWWYTAAPYGREVGRLETLMLIFFGAGILFLFFFRVRWTMFFLGMSALLALLLKSDLRYCVLPQEERPLTTLSVRFIDYTDELPFNWRSQLLHLEGDVLVLRLPDTLVCPEDLRTLVFRWPQIWCEGHKSNYMLLSRLPFREEVASLPLGMHQKYLSIPQKKELLLLTGEWKVGAHPISTLEAMLQVIAKANQPTIWLLHMKWPELFEHLRQLRQRFGVCICQVVHVPFQPSLPRWRRLNRRATWVVMHNDYVRCRDFRLFNEQGTRSRALLYVFINDNQQCNEASY